MSPSRGRSLVDQAERYGLIAALALMVVQSRRTIWKFSDVAAVRREARPDGPL